MDKKVLVYQAYGLEDVIRQTQFSMISLISKIAKPGSVEIWVYTDRKDLFTPYFGSYPHIVYKEITMDQVKKWRGAIDFVHRVKVEILRDAGKQFDGPLFYADGDTYYLSDPTEMFSHVNDRYSLMHIAENALIDGKDPLSKKILKFCKKHQFDIHGEHVAIGPSTVMWNAGVLGISQNNKKLLPSVLELTDQMHSTYQKHVMEQLAFSFFLQTRSQVQAADHVIYHYWNQKPEYQATIDRFLNDTKFLETGLKEYAKFPWPAPPAPKKKKLGAGAWSKILGWTHRPR